MSGRELYKIMIKNDLDFVIDKIIEKNNDLTIKELKIEELEKEIERLNNIIDEFEDWLGKQRIRNCEWDNFVIKDTRLGIPITYLLNKLKELKEE